MALVLIGVGVGRIQDWVETWNLVNAMLMDQATAFPDFELSVEDFTIRAGEDAFPVLTAQIDAIILGGVVAPQDGGITSLIIVGQPDDPQSRAAFLIWLATLDPTIDTELLLPVSGELGDDERNTVESNGRTYEVIKVDGATGAAVSISMVMGRSISSQATASAHRVVRSNVLGALVADG